MKLRIFLCSLAVLLLCACAISSDAEPAFVMKAELGRIDGLWVLGKGVYRIFDPETGVTCYYFSALSSGSVSCVKTEEGW